jgi:phosphoadenosine phosphosulfate reductase
VWEFLNERVKVSHCELYDEGFTRIGCVGCPLQSSRGMRRDFERWPQYKELYIKAFDKMLLNRRDDTFSNGREVLEDWIRRT